MEQDEDTSTMSPFWVPNDNRRRLRRSYSMLLTSTSFLVLLLVIALVFGLIILPTLRSFTSNIFKPNAVKHSWDSLNLILVLFAVVCGFLTKNDTNETKTPRFDNYNPQRSFSNPPTPPSWYEHNNRSFNRLRSFGSYPDLRQYSPVVADDDRYRFYDDTNLFLRNPRFRLEGEEEFVASGEVSASPVRLPEMKPPLTSQPEAVRRNDEETSQTETIEEHDLDAENSQPPPPPPMPAVRKKKRGTATKENVATVTSASQVMKSDPEPQPPPQVMRTKAVRRNANTKRTYRAEMTEKLENDDFFAVNSQPPPQPPSPPPLHTERKTDMQVKKKRGSATKEFLTSLKGKKKKQRQRSVENFETLLRNSQPVSHQPPPPPPPPPPPSVFHNLLSFNKSKYKTHYHVPMEIHKPKLPNKREHSYYSLEDNVKDNVNVNVMTTGNESPLIPIPPPPPPPPFKLPAWKFRVQGDYVRVDSIGSSRSSSPDIDEAVESPTSQDQEDTSQCNSNTNSPYAPKCEDHVTETASASASAAPLFCPSPDVDTKAQNFIKNFRAGLRIAKMNSMKEKQGIGRSKLSNLGPLQNP